MGAQIEKGVNGLEKVVLTTSDGVVEVYRLGATLTRFVVGAGGGEEVVFCSKNSPFLVGKAIRGGVPICWPWFGPHPSDAAMPQHGFVRVKEWEVAEIGERVVVLETSSSEETKKLFPYDFKLRFRVEVAARGKLSMALETVNVGKEAFVVGEALHTYFVVGDVGKVGVTGFEGLEYVDKVDGKKVKREASAKVGLNGEVDRVYMGAKGPHVIEDGSRKVTVSKKGSGDTVLWNPGEKKAEGMADLSGGQWPGFVCVEAVNTGPNSVKVEAGGRHVMECGIEVS